MVKQVIGLHTLGHRKSGLLDIPDNLPDSRDRARGIGAEQHWLDHTLPYDGRDCMVGIKHLLPCVTSVTSKQLVTSVASKELFYPMVAREESAIVGRKGG